ncbi:MAG: S46 family peptidase, partial [Rikenellaceae bacterium]|nr:S46 family peptidase [Rikenellaceae bacterium]
MKKALLFIMSALFVAGTSLESRADEGMWLPSTINKTRIKQMQQRGLKLKAQDLYNENGTSLKDAIVLFGTGCTGELISGEGLLLTNHHCGYSAIQSHSTVEHDYLTNGFLSMNRSEELPTGFTVSFLVRMEDVTDQVLAGTNENMTTEERNEIIKKNAEAVKAKANEGNSYKIDIKPWFYGNQYFMYVFEVFEDIRMVGAPPSSI